MEENSMKKTLMSSLPEEIVDECLIRVHHQSFPLLRGVCRRWNQLLGSPDFLRFRRSAGHARSLLVLSQAESSSFFHSGPAINYAACFPFHRLVVHDPATGDWATLPQIPGLRENVPRFCRLAAVGGVLVVIGGWDPDTWSASDGVYVYSFLTGSWRRGRSMPGPRRSFFACSGGAGMVLVAGGRDEDKNALRSAMVYDVSADQWTELREMRSERDDCDGMFVDRGFLVVGGCGTAMQAKFGWSAEEFDIWEWRWRPIVEDALEAEGCCLRSCAASGEGRIYSCGINGRLVMKEGRDGGWKTVAEFPEDAQMAPLLASWGTKCRCGRVGWKQQRTGDIYV
ncbi:hypothetical protein HPP92_003641 [Vanilla planifolia]|uniref:F-box domain-containing protein n=1 Tax=Vanilla planifolia TaxID=51239 RepID=A0A835RUT7_VANPL|nr:hypothetical protein HPP92_003641 [Vanilla planifolia]